MRSWMLCALLATAVVVPAFAQKDKEKAKDKEKGKDTPKVLAPSVEIKEGEDSKFRFFVRSGGEKARLLAMSGSPYASAKDAEKGYATFKAALPTATLKGPKDKPKANYIEVKKGKDDKFRYFIHGADGKLAASSGVSGYESEKEANKAIFELRAAVAVAKVSSPAAKDAGKDGKEKDGKKKDGKKDKDK
jgi:uncharacterized protein YegP (UPF0339 family)